ncbi:hypothetical protein [Anaeromicropila herbilytica]|uniref:Uncharacterized protein n=1 Tax=Anaeromicropila herbilytica TaxID=2785025 RepID=A0A7R7IBF1_9FIRM|nr:hypothetical protein [Anaeromicropila herbilytica]BCN29583.1 hypothetical protein bsdtb5_08780 [Anaeromicropila herbilytica]
MVQKPWFKIFIWFLATFFFFLASGVIISLLKPGPSESEVMQYMSGMMGAMESSIMGVMMGMESNQLLQNFFLLTLILFPIIVIFSLIIGFVLRRKNSEVKNDQ